MTTENTEIARSNAAIERRQTAIAKLDRPLLNIYEEVREEQTEVAQATLEAYWRVGTILKKVVDDSNTYKRASIGLLADALGLGQDSLYKAISFREQYTDAQYESLRALRMPTGEPLTWTHVAHLLTVSDVQRREWFQANAAKLGWSSDALLQAIRADRPNDRVPGSGRPFVQPKTILEGFRNLAVTAADVTRRSEAVWGPIFEKAEQAPDEEIDQELLDQLKRTAASADTMLKAMSAHHERATALATRYADALERKKTPKLVAPPPEKPAAAPPKAAAKKAVKKVVKAAAKKAK